MVSVDPSSTRWTGLIIPPTPEEVVIVRDALEKTAAKLQSPSTVKVTLFLTSVRSGQSLPSTTVHPLN